MFPVGVEADCRAFKYASARWESGSSTGRRLEGFSVCSTLSGPHPIARAPSVAAWEKSTNRYVLGLGGSSRTIRWPRRKPKAGGVERHMGLPVRADTSGPLYLTVRGVGGAFGTRGVVRWISTQHI